MINGLQNISLSPKTIERMHQTYRKLHANPELSMQEYETSKYILQCLEQLGLEVFSCAGTGVVGILRNGEGPTVAFRADMDALPLAESTGLDYASSVRRTLPDGSEVPVMHACGHDVHMAAALAAAETMCHYREHWRGTVVFIFQPGEETLEGAKAMIADGLWSKAPKPEIVYGQHVMACRAGSVRLTKGTTKAIGDGWTVTINGRGAHGSEPEESIDPVVIAASIVVRLQSIIAREVSPLDAAVVTVGTFHAGHKSNIIPETAEFTLDIRTFDPSVRLKVLASLRRTIEGEAQISGAPQPEIVENYTSSHCFNHPEETQKIIEEFQSVLGAEKVSEVPPVMAGEDFGFLVESLGVPAVFWHFGGYPEEAFSSANKVAGNHSPYFAPAIEPTLSTGAIAATAALLSKLRIVK